MKTLTFMEKLQQSMDQERHKIAQMSYQEREAYLWPTLHSKPN